MPFMGLTAEPAYHHPPHKAKPDPALEREHTAADPRRPPQLIPAYCRCRNGCVCASSREPATAHNRDSFAFAGERDPFQPGPVQYIDTPAETRGGSSDTCYETSIDDYNAAARSELGSDDNAAGRVDESMDANGWGSSSPGDSMLLEPRDESSPPGSGFLPQTHLSGLLDHVGGGPDSPAPHFFGPGGYPLELSIGSLGGEFAEFDLW